MWCPHYPHQRWQWSGPTAPRLLPPLAGAWTRPLRSPTPLPRLQWTRPLHSSAHPPPPYASWFGPRIKGTQAQGALGAENACSRVCYSVRAALAHAGMDTWRAPGSGEPPQSSSGRVQTSVLQLLFSARFSGRLCPCRGKPRPWPCSTGRIAELPPPARGVSTWSGGLAPGRSSRHANGGPLAAAAGPLLLVRGAGLLRSQGRAGQVPRRVRVVLRLLPPIR